MAASKIMAASKREKAKISGAGIVKSKYHDVNIEMKMSVMYRISASA